MIPLIALGIVISGIWGLRNPFVGLIGLLAATIIQPGELFPLFNALHVERILSAVVFISMYTHGEKFKFPPITKKILWFYASCLASIPLSFWLGNSITSAIDFAKIIILSVMITSLIQTREQMRIFLFTLAALIAYLAASSLILYLQGNFQFTMDVDRARGLTSASDNPDTLGLTIDMSLPICCLFLTKGTKLWMKLLTVVMILICLSALMLTGSRGSVLTLLLMAAIAALRSRKRFIIIPLAIMLSLGVWNILPAQYQARYSTVDHLKNDESYQNRLISWHGGWLMFLHNPLTGIGIGDYVYANGMKYWPGPGRRHFLDAHSLYFKALGELGLFGFITFFSFVWVFSRTNREMGRQTRGDPGKYPGWMRGYTAACNLDLIGLMYCGYAYHDLYRDTWFTLAGISAAMYLILQREMQESGKTTPGDTDGAAIQSGSLAMATFKAVQPEGR